jgi:hypothetical protein
MPQQGTESGVIAVGLMINVDSNNQDCSGERPAPASEPPEQDPPTE